MSPSRAPARRDPRGTPRARATHAEISIEESRFAEVERAARDGVAFFQKQKFPTGLALASTLLGEALLRQKKLPDARRAADIAMPAAREGAFWGDQFDARVLDARITSAQGDPSAALAKLGPILADAIARTAAFPANSTRDSRPAKPSSRPGRPGANGSKRSKETRRRKASS